MSKGDNLGFSNPGVAYLNEQVEIDKAVKQVLLSGNYILGEQVKAFEIAFSKYLGVDYSIGLNSGTDALIYGLRASGVGPGDEVITTSLTASATAAAIKMVGADPVYVDIDEETLNMDPNKIELVISDKTVAIIAVHLYGNPCNMKKLKEIASRYDLLLIEDCAQAAGAEFMNRKVGSFGHLSCFSFYPTKNLGAIGDGGALATSDEIIQSKVNALRQYGWNESRVSMKVSGVSRLDEIQAAILNLRLASLDLRNARRREIAKIYSDLLDPLKFRKVLEAEHAMHVYHLFVVKVSKRTSLIERMSSSGISLGIHYSVPTHKQDALSGRKKNQLPITEKACKEIVSLPMYPELEDDDIKIICEMLNRYGEEYYV